MDAETKVVFRKFKNGEILALFPEIKSKVASGTYCESYMHVGQHGHAVYGHCINTTVPATEEEYLPLKKELEEIGYVLKIRKKYSTGRR